MFIKLKRGEQKKLLMKAIKNAGSQRKLSKIINIPNSSIARYLNGNNSMLEERFDKLANFIEIADKERLIEKKLPTNWMQVKGGKQCVLSKIKKGTFERDMKILQNIQSDKLKKWHKMMRTTKPKEYYKIQYSRFKKIGGYKFTTKNGEKVRNLFEKEVADILFKNKVKYQYEPLVHVGKRFFFPDFLLDNKVIIECTMWRGIEKAYKLREKCKILGKKYKVFVVIPKNLYTYYKIIGSNLIQGLDKFAPVAQTFSRETAKGSNR